MQKFPTKTLILCVTVLVAIGLVRDSLCRVEYQGGGSKFAAVLAYEVK
ncbi:Hok/Gef family protein [Vibrio aestuarianus]|nr:Hok/Gef family protein [Vibrio aestuarianus]NGZ17580.1 Hok/Gef family protein [Vibrio aestuarianus]